MCTKCLTVFIFAVLLAALLQGCGNQGAQEETTDKKPKKKAVDEEETCNLKEGFETVFRILEVDADFMESLQDEGKECVLQHFKKEEGCRLIRKVGNVDDVEVVSHLEVLPSGEVGNHDLSVESNALLTCKHLTLCLAPDHVYVIKLSDEDGNGAMVNELLAHTQVCDESDDHVRISTVADEGRPTDSSSLIEHKRVNSSRSNNGADSQRATGTRKVTSTKSADNAEFRRATDTREIVTAAKSQQIMANATASSSLPVYRVPRSNRAVDDAIVHEMAKMNPQVFAHLHREGNK